MTQGSWLQCVESQAVVKVLSTDSRQIFTPVVSAFFALRGPQNDGHAYLETVYAAGVRNLIVDRPIEVLPFPEANIIYVEHTLLALQRLAAAHRKRFGYPVVGITGSNGKTIVKEWLFQLLSPEWRVVRSPKSYNSQIGVPLSIWQMWENHEFGLFEAGISLPGEMEKLEAVIQPDIGIFTNIRSAHREGFESKKAKAAEKMQLFTHAKVLIYCADHPLVHELCTEWATGDRQLIGWSALGRDASIQISHISPEADGFTHFQVSSRGSRWKCCLPFKDEAALENALHCIALLLHLGYLPDTISDRMRRLEAVEMRLELKAGINHCLLINDAYSNDPSSLRLALQFAGRQRQNKRFTVILSDLLQTGREDADLYERVAAEILEQKLDRLIGIGRHIPAIQTFLPKQFEATFFPDTATFLQQFRAENFRDELILLKGARTFAFERVAGRLEQKAHKTRLEVDLNALVHNFNIFKKRLTPSTKLMVMVKAAGYGSGAAQIARLLEFHHADYLGVAYADEGVELRQAGVNLPILVLNPEPTDWDLLYRYRLEPEIYSLNQWEQLLAYVGTSRALTIHLKLETGMRRLGFEREALDNLLREPALRANIRIGSVFSHLVGSDDSKHDTFTHAQASLFAATASHIESVVGYQPLRHLLNSGGIYRFPAYHFDMVRLGIGLYGIGGDEEKAVLKNVNTLKATVSQVKWVRRGDSVGYGRRGIAPSDGRVAIISIGYADGYLRRAGNGNHSVRINNGCYPTIGNICMDMCMVFIGNSSDVKEGDEVIIFGEDHPVQDLADALGTIPYEVFTGISDRVKRVYWQE